MSSSKSWLSPFVAPIIGVLVAIIFLLLWESASSNSRLVGLFVSSPSSIFRYSISQGGPLIHAFWITGLESVLGIFLALVVSLSSGAVVTMSPELVRWVLPPMIVSQVVPIITIAPLLIIIFGIGLPSKIIMAAIISFFPILVNVLVSIRDLPIGVKEMVLLYKPSWKFRLLYIHFPLSLPALMAGLRVASTLAVIGAIVSEFTGAEFGLGKNLFLATRRLDPELMMSSLVLSAVLGGLLFLNVVLMERLIGKWYLRQ